MLVLKYVHFCNTNNLDWYGQVVSPCKILLLGSLLCFQHLQISFSMITCTPELRTVSHCKLQMSYKGSHIFSKT